MKNAAGTSVNNDNDVSQHLAEMLKHHFPDRKDRINYKARRVVKCNSGRTLPHSITSLFVPICCHEKDWDWIKTRFAFFPVPVTVPLPVLHVLMVGKRERL
jgi:hypothetical protein